jgi:hypothetical protein
MNKQIFILWPTIRPAMFIKAVKKWFDRSTYMDYSIFAAVGNKKQADEIANVYGKMVNLFIAPPGMCAALHGLCSSLGFRNESDIVMVGYDDIVPPYGWDEIILKEFDNFNGAVLFNDGLQKWPAPLFCQPCLSVAALKRLNGIIFHPAYNHLYPDNELYANCKELGMLKDVRQTNKAIFEHVHHSIGKRTSDYVDVHITSVEAVDRATWERRQRMTLEERLKV